jgi:exodeoxyribonuclease V alpha subunit
MDISSLIQKVEARIGVNYADKQREAIFRCMNGGVTVITGGPGTGKTTVVKGIISIFNDLDLKTALAAPTGRAAKRMSEATGEEAKTIHRLLEMERTDTDELKFNRNSRNPLEEKVVIVDEASMIDLSLMNALTQALKRGTRLILIGDSDQLPSVGAGNVLDDLITSGAVDTIRLTEIFRQSKESLIITNAHKINRGESPTLNVTNNDFFFVRRENEREIADTVADLITKRLPKTYGNAIREQIQVISPSKKGAGGVDLLNSELQSRVNPKATFKKEKSSHGVIFREGDRVMQVVNNYDIEWEKNGLSGFGIFNGDIGIIESIDFKDEVLNIWFDDRFVRYDFENLEELELSYAITVHKSQGSEYPVVIVPMYSCPPMLMTRNLLYTAVTRAKRMVILVGRSDIPDRMVKNNREVLRYTTLCSRLNRS